MSPVNSTGILEIAKVNACALILSWIRASQAKRRKVREIKGARTNEASQETYYYQYVTIVEDV
jgi:hypothetical protein